MKSKILLVLAVAFLLFSCTQIANNVTDVELSCKAAGHHLYYCDGFNSLNSYSDISNWIATNVTYKSESNDNWQEPKTTVQKGTGDCEDFAILYMNILYVRFGIKADLIILDHDNMTRTIMDGGKINHAIIYFAGKYIDPQKGIEYRPSKIGYKYSFDEVF